MIVMMESTKNRSALIRDALHTLQLRNAQREYRRKLEKLVITYAKLAEAPQPKLQSIWEMCLNNNRVSAEASEEE